MNPTVDIPLTQNEVKMEPKTHQRINVLFDSLPNTKNIQNLTKPKLSPIWEPGEVPTNQLFAASSPRLRQSAQGGPETLQGATK